MDASFAIVVIFGGISALALFFFVKGLIDFIRGAKEEGGEPGKAKPVKGVAMENNKTVSAIKQTQVATAVKEPEVATATKQPEVATVEKPEFTAKVEPKEPVKKSDHPPVRVQGPNGESDKRVAEIQEIINKYV